MGCAVGQYFLNGSYVHDTNCAATASKERDATVGRSSRQARPLFVSQLHCLENSLDTTRQPTSSWASTPSKHPDNRGVIYAVITTALESTRTHTHIHHISRGRTFDGALPFIHQSFSSVKTLEPITAFTLSFLANHSQDSRFTMATHVINAQCSLDTCSVGMLSHYCVKQGCQTPPRLLSGTWRKYNTRTQW